MRPAEFGEQNTILGRPPNMTDEECAFLPVWTDARQCVSLWRASWRERLSFLLFGKLWLTVLCGYSHPPVAMNVTKKFFLEADDEQ